MPNDKPLGAAPPSPSSAADLMAQIESRRAELERGNEADRATIEEARQRIANRKAELDALPVARTRRKKTAT